MQIRLRSTDSCVWESVSHIYILQNSYQAKSSTFEIGISSRISLSYGFADMKCLYLASEEMPGMQSEFFLERSFFLNAIGSGIVQQFFETLKSSVEKQTSVGS